MVIAGGTRVAKFARNMTNVSLQRMAFIVFTLCSGGVSACGDSTGDAGGGFAEGGGGASGGAGGAGSALDQSVCDPDAGPFSLVIDHPYSPMEVGQVWTYDGEEDGVAVHLVIAVTDETEDVAGITTRIVEERADEEGELHEVARNFFAQAPDGTICYFGETTDFYENGEIVGHEGAWRAGVGENLPGIFLPANPSVGDSYDQERAPGVSEDHAVVEAIGLPFTVPAGSFDDTLDTEETSPLDPGVAEEKRYAAGVGLIVSGPLLLESY